MKMKQGLSILIDVSGSMTDHQILYAMDKACEEYSIDDEIFIFDHSQAEFISFEDVVDYSLGKSVDDLKKYLFKKGSHTRWSGSGVDAALKMSSYKTRKLCVTDGFISALDKSSLDKIVIIPLYP